MALPRSKGNGVICHLQKNACRGLYPVCTNDEAGIYRQCVRIGECVRNQSVDERRRTFTHEPSRFEKVVTTPSFRISVLPESLHRTSRHSRHVSQLVMQKYSLRL